MRANQFVPVWCGGIIIRWREGWARWQTSVAYARDIFFVLFELFNAQTGKLWNFLPASVFPSTYDLISFRFQDI